MIIGLDLDGVLADFERQLRFKYRDHYGESILVEADSKYGLVDDHMHFESHTQFWNWVDSMPDFWSSMPECQSAMGLVYDLQRDGHSIRVVTARQPTRGPEGSSCGLQTELWVGARWPSGLTPSTHYVPAAEKYKVPTQVFLDDSPEVVEALVASGHNHAYLLDRPWNREADVPRVANHGEFLGIVRGLDAG